MPFEKILCANVVGIEEDEAIPQAYLRSRRYGSNLSFLRVFPDPEPASLLFPDFHEKFALARSEWITYLMEDLAQRVARITGLERERLNLNVEFGSPVSIIVQKAEEWNCDLLVIPGYEKGQHANHPLKSLVERIVRHARGPVLVAKKGSHHKHVLAATDFSDPSLPAVAAAAEESRVGVSKLTLMHSLDLSPLYLPETVVGSILPGVRPSQSELEALRQQAEQHLREALQKFSAEGAAMVSHGPAGQAIVETAERLEAGLVVVGTIGRTGLTRLLLGSVAEFVISHAPCSVLVVRLQSR